jgi:hypothetical protein
VLSEVGRVGATFSERPVHARRALRCVIFQSDVPSRWRMVREVLVEGVEIIAERDVVDVIRWYRKGMPLMARRKGVRRRRVDIVSSAASDDTPTRVPRRV